MTPWSEATQAAVKEALEKIDGLAQMIGDDQIGSLAFNILELIQQEEERE